MVEAVSTQPLTVRLGLKLAPVCVGFVAEKLKLRHVSVPVLRFIAVSSILPMLHTHSLIYNRLCIFLTILTVSLNNTNQLTILCAIHLPNCTACSSLPQLPHLQSTCSTASSEIQLLNCPAYNPPAPPANHLLNCPPCSHLQFTSSNAPLAIHLLNCPTHNPPYQLPNSMFPSLQLMPLPNSNNPEEQAGFSSNT